MPRGFTSCYVDKLFHVGFGYVPIGCFSRFRSFRLASKPTTYTSLILDPGLALGYTGFVSGLEASPPAAYFLKSSILTLSKALWSVACRKTLEYTYQPNSF